jgi:hypothetical protein
MLLRYPEQPETGSQTRRIDELINRLATCTLHRNSEETGCYFREAAERVPKGIMIRPFVKLTKADIED